MHKTELFIKIVKIIVQTFPKHEIYGLTSQFRRAAVSVAANIAEGFRKRSKADKVRFYNIAQGSVEECRYYLILAKDLEYGDISETKLLLQEVSKLLEAWVLSRAAEQKSTIKQNKPNLLNKPRRSPLIKNLSP